MSLWDERYTDEKFGLETPASFRYFQMYLQQPYPRSIKALCEQVNSQQKSLNKSQTKLDTFYKYSKNWKWIKRAGAYDEYLKDLHFKTKEKEVMAWESEQLALAKERAKLHSDTLNKIHKADEDVFPLTKKAYAEETNERAYNESIDAVYKLLYGGVVKAENTNRTDVNLDGAVKLEQQTTAEVKMQKLKELHEQMDEMTYD